jgi:hypothetical protein
VSLRPELSGVSSPTDYNAAIGKVDAHRLAFELVQTLDGLWCDDLHLLIVEPGHIVELLLDAVGDALLVEVVKRVCAYDAEIDAL